MTLLILAETSAGYALFKAKDKKLLKRNDIAKEAATAEGACSLFKLKQFQKFDSATSALNEAAALTEGKVSPMLANMLSSLKDEKKVSLAVADPKLGNAITKIAGLDIAPISDSTTADVHRAIREHLSSLIPDLAPQEFSTMNLGLSHSLSRHKLKFSPDKVDTMIIQAIALLDDLDKELNQYAMRVKEWYGWHFPEMARIINDNVAYSKVILAVGMRHDAVDADLSDILPEEIETAVKAAAEMSMGSEITDEDLVIIKTLAGEVVGFTEYRQTLNSYLSARMQAIAPNLTVLVGELVGARLIAHAGSLMSLAKSPASTIQILGAEKALFRALKTKHDTPKYGLIYHASLVGQASGKNKGKIARMLAAKSALGLRTDSLSDWGQIGEGAGEEPTEDEKMTVGINGRALVERRLRQLEGKALRPTGTTIGPQGQRGDEQPGKWAIKEASKYNPDADGISPDARPQTNGTPANTGKKRKIEEIESTSSKKTKAGAEDEDDDDDDDEVTQLTNGVNGTPKAKETKEERAARKAKKAAKKAAKAEKAGTKRKHDAADDEDTTKEKKKKKKSKE
ncbi:hypothetical protein AMS68_003168 [Peltaster fructicola]|uniref:Nucleolar protein 58 n=1 Tax=Peltaster fructicola TaxID=286661 RepID=A0A6H0XSL6_9PEZI|nr:hypothetical protein AMS68_003168 [Peltaster fructicola]